MMIQLKDLCQKASSNIAQKDLEGHEGQYPIYGASGLIGYVDFYKQENPYVAGEIWTKSGTDRCASYG